MRVSALNALTVASGYSWALLATEANPRDAWWRKVTEVTKENWIDCSQEIHSGAWLVSVVSFHLASTLHSWLAPACDGGVEEVQANPGEFVG